MKVLTWLRIFLISEGFSRWLQSSKKGAKSRQIFWRLESKWKNLTTFSNMLHNYGLRPAGSGGMNHQNKIFSFIPRNKVWSETKVNKRSLYARFWPFCCLMKWPLYNHFWLFFRPLYVHLSQNLGSDGYFEVLTESKS